MKSRLPCASRSPSLYGRTHFVSPNLSRSGSHVRASNIGTPSPRKSAFHFGTISPKIVTPAPPIHHCKPFGSVVRCQPFPQTGPDRSLAEPISQFKNERRLSHVCTHP